MNATLLVRKLFAAGESTAHTLPFSASPASAGPGRRKRLSVSERQQAARAARAARTARLATGTAASRSRADEGKRGQEAARAAAYGEVCMCMCMYMQTHMHMRRAPRRSAR